MFDLGNKQDIIFERSKLADKRLMQRTACEYIVLVCPSWPVKRFSKEISRCWKWIISICLMTFGQFHTFFRLLFLLFKTIKFRLRVSVPRALFNAVKKSVLFSSSYFVLFCFWSIVMSFLFMDAFCSNSLQRVCVYSSFSVIIWIEWTS